MNAVTRPSALVPHVGVSMFTPSEVALIRRTCAKGATDDEFNVFMKTACALLLNPLRKQVYLNIYSADNAERRRMSIIIGIDGFRDVADRTGNYRPDDQLPVFTILPWKVSREKAIVEMRAEAERLPIKDRKAHLAETAAAIDELYPMDPANPEGIEKVTVRVFKYAHGEWFPVASEAYWAEYAPVKEDAEGGFDWVETGGFWATSKPKMRKVARGVIVKRVDDSGKWASMPHGQLEKCAEAKAHRKASWSGALANVYVEQEFDHSKAIDLDPSQIADLGAQQARLARVQSKDCLMITWNGTSNEAPEEVPYGALPDRVFEFIERHAGEPQIIADWEIRNRHNLRTFWAVRKSDALEIKKRIEAATAAREVVA